MFQSHTLRATLLAPLLAALFLSACAPAQITPPEEGHSDDHGHHSEGENSAALVLSGDGGISLVNRLTLEVETELTAVLPAGLSFSAQQIAGGPHGELFILADDGRLYTIEDSHTGEVTDSWQVIQPWSLSNDRSEAQPILFVLGHDVYVSDPAVSMLYRLDSHSGEILAQLSFVHAPESFSGFAASPDAHHDHDAGHDHGHDDDDHDNHDDEHGDDH